MADTDRHDGARSPDGAKKARIGLDEEHLFGVHPDGVGQTLGGDLLRPNPGHDLPTEADDEDQTDEQVLERLFALNQERAAAGR